MLKLKKLTSEQEAKAFDRERFGDEAELTQQERKRIQTRNDNIKAGEAKAKEDRLNAVIGFDTDPISFLKEKLTAGDYQGRDRLHNYLLLITLIKIQQSLESSDLNLLSRK